MSTRQLQSRSVARAAGCSVRALQLGFRRFRNTTPMSALRQARLKRALDEIVRSDGSFSVIDVAARHGFGNAGRFSDIYRRAFGEYPSETLRARVAEPGAEPLTNNLTVQLERREA